MSSGARAELAKAMTATYAFKGCFPELFPGDVLLHYPFGSSHEAFLDPAWSRRFDVGNDLEAFQNIAREPQIYDSGTYIAEHGEASQHGAGSKRTRSCLSLVDVASKSVPRCLNWKVHSLNSSNLVDDQRKSAAHNQCFATYRVLETVPGDSDAPAVEICFQNLELEFRTSVKRHLDLNAGIQVVVRLLRLGGSSELVPQSVLTLRNVQAQSHHESVDEVTRRDVYHARRGSSSDSDDEFDEARPGMDGIVEGWPHSGRGFSTSAGAKSFKMPPSSVQEVIHRDGRHEEMVESLSAPNRQLTGRAPFGEFVEFMEAVHSSNAFDNVHTCLTVEVFEQEIVSAGGAPADTTTSPEGEAASGLSSSRWALRGAVKVPCTLTSLLEVVCGGQQFGTRTATNASEKLLHALAHHSLRVLRENPCEQNCSLSSGGDEAEPVADEIGQEVDALADFFTHLPCEHRTPSNIGNVVVPLMAAFFSARRNPRISRGPEHEPPVLIWTSTGRVLIAHVQIIMGSTWSPWKRPLMSSRHVQSRHSARHGSSGGHQSLLKRLGSALQGSNSSGIVEVALGAAGIWEARMGSEIAHGSDNGTGNKLGDAVLALDIVSLLLELGVDVPPSSQESETAAVYETPRNLIAPAVCDLSFAAWVSAVKRLSTKDGNLLSMCQTDLSRTLSTERFHQFPLAVSSVGLLQNVAYTLTTRNSNVPVVSRLEVVWNQFGEDVAEDSCNLVSYLGRQHHIVFARTTRSRDWSDFVNNCGFEMCDGRSSFQQQDEEPLQFAAVLGVGGWSAAGALRTSGATADVSSEEDQPSEASIAPLVFFPVAVHVHRNPSRDPVRADRLFWLELSGIPFPNHVVLAQEKDLFRQCARQSGEWNACEFLGYVCQHFADQFSTNCALIAIPRAGLGGALMPSVPCSDMLPGDLVMNDMMSHLATSSNIGLWTFILHQRHLQERSQDQGSLVDAAGAGDQLERFQRQLLRLNNLDSSQASAVETWARMDYGTLLVSGASGSGKSFVGVSLLVNAVLQSQSVFVLTKSSNQALDVFNGVALVTEDTALVLEDNDCLAKLRDQLSKCRELSGSVSTVDSNRFQNEYSRALRDFEVACENFKSAQNALHLHAQATNIDFGSLPQSPYTRLAYFRDMDRDVQRAFATLLKAHLSRCQCRVMHKIGRNAVLREAAELLATTDAGNQGTVHSAETFRSHPGAGALIKLLFPVVIGRPEDCALWMKASVGTFDRVIIDSVEDFRLFECIGAIARCTGTLLLTTSVPENHALTNRRLVGSNRRWLAFVDTLPSASVQRCTLKNSFRSVAVATSHSEGRRLLPLPSSVIRKYTAQRFFVQGPPVSERSWRSMFKAKRIEGNIRSAEKCVQGILDTLLGKKDHSKILESVAEYVKRLRGAAVNIGEAVAICTRCLSLNSTMPGASCVIATVTPGQCHLLHALMLCLHASSVRMRIKIRVVSDTEFQHAQVCDFVLCSLVFSQRTGLPWRGMSSERMKDLVGTCLSTPRVQSVVYFSGDSLEAWCNHRPRAGVFARMGYMLKDAIAASQTPNAVRAVSAWAQDLKTKLVQTSSALNINPHESLWHWEEASFQIFGTVFSAISFSDIIVLCHANNESGPATAIERFDILPRLLELWHWKRVVHAFEPARGPFDVASLIHDVCGLQNMLHLSIVRTPGGHDVQLQVQPRAQIGQQLFLPLLASIRDRIVVVRRINTPAQRSGGLNMTTRMSPCSSALDVQWPIQFLDHLSFSLTDLQSWNVEYELWDVHQDSRLLQVVSMQVPFCGDDQCHLCHHETIDDNSDGNLSQVDDTTPNDRNELEETSGCGDDVGGNDDYGDDFGDDLSEGASGDFDPASEQVLDPPALNMSDDCSSLCWQCHSTHVSAYEVKFRHWTQDQSVQQWMSESTESRSMPIVEMKSRCGLDQDVEMDFEVCVRAHSALGVSEWSHTFVSINGDSRNAMPQQVDVAHIQDAIQFGEVSVVDADNKGPRVNAGLFAAGGTVQLQISASVKSRLDSWCMKNLTFKVSGFLHLPELDVALPVQLTGDFGTGAVANFHRANGDAGMTAKLTFSVRAADGTVPNWVFHALLTRASVCSFRIQIDAHVGKLASRVLRHNCFVQAEIVPCSAQDEIAPTSVQHPFIKLAISYMCTLFEAKEGTSESTFMSYFVELVDRVCKFVHRIQERILAALFVASNGATVLIPDLQRLFNQVKLTDSNSGINTDHVHSVFLEVASTAAAFLHEFCNSRAHKNKSSRFQSMMWTHAANAFGAADSDLGRPFASRHHILLQVLRALALPSNDELSSQGRFFYRCRCCAQYVFYHLSFPIDDAAENDPNGPGTDHADSSLQTDALCLKNFQVATFDEHALVSSGSIVSAMFDNYGHDWRNEFSTVATLTESARSTGDGANVLLSALLSGSPVCFTFESRSSRHSISSWLCAWTFRSRQRGTISIVGEHVLAVGKCKNRTFQSEPLLLVPITVMCIEHDAVFFQRHAMAHPFLNPSIFPKSMIPDSGCFHGQCASETTFTFINLDHIFKHAAMLKPDLEFEPAVSILTCSTPNGCDKIMLNPVLDVLKFAPRWLSSDTRSSFEVIAFPKVSGPNEGPGPSDDFAMWQQSNPMQFLGADVSQRRAVEMARSGRSFVLRGPPGCGKTQSLVNMVMALLADGKSVLVSAKLQSALTVFNDKFRAVQRDACRQHKNSGTISALTTSLFMTKDGTKVSLKGNGIVNDHRFVVWSYKYNLEQFWVDDTNGTESIVRKYIKDGWSPDFEQIEPLRSAAGQGVVALKLVKKKKEMYVCSLCSHQFRPKTQARTVVAHVQKHLNDRQNWTDDMFFSAQYEKRRWKEVKGASHLSSYIVNELVTAQHNLLELLKNVDREIFELEALVRQYQSSVCHHESLADNATKCGHFVRDDGCGSQCVGFGCCISRNSLLDCASLIIEGFVAIRSLQQRTSRASGTHETSLEDIAFLQNVCLPFAECHTCCCTDSRGTVHAVLNGIHNIKHSDHATSCSIIHSLIDHLTHSERKSASPCMHASTVMKGLDDVSRDAERLQLRCLLVEAIVAHAWVCALDLSTAKNVVLLTSTKKLVDKLQTAEAMRKLVCYDSAQSQCDLQLLKFLSQHPDAIEQLLEAFSKMKNLEQRARSLMSVLAAGDGSTEVTFELVQKLFPVFVMTSEEVVRHVPPFVCQDGMLRPPFDVVFFDEASQLPTHQAMGAMGRARQCVVIGDDKQLPPREKCPGLLDDCLSSATIPLVPLTWHYRSAHSSLIQFSNELFYNNTLQVLPSANDFLAGTKNNDKTTTDAVGLVKLVCPGFMQSNYRVRNEIQACIDNLRLKNAETVYYAASPQGYVNCGQALQIVDELHMYMQRIAREARPFSVGIITLNRPQRQLIHSMVSACSQKLGLVDKKNNLFARVSPSEGDCPMFIQSIDQIQGEERDLILFSTLLAPKGPCPVPSSAFPSVSASSQANVANTEDNDEEENDEDIFDNLERRPADGDDDAIEDDNLPRESTDAQPASENVAREASGPARAPRSGHFSYSTIAHAHGHRLLNVGLTRAVNTMKVLHHSSMQAPSEHDPKLGKQAFGWLVRFLLHERPNCSCASCTQRYARLTSLSSQSQSASDGRQVLDPPSSLWIHTHKAFLCQQGDEESPLSEIHASACGIGAKAVRVGVGLSTRATSSRSSPTHNHRTVAVMIDGENSALIPPRDLLGIGSMLTFSKVGWSQCSHLSVGDLFQTLQRVHQSTQTRDIEFVDGVGSWLSLALERPTAEPLFAEPNRYVSWFTALTEGASAGHKPPSTSASRSSDDGQEEVPKRLRGKKLWKAEVGQIVGHCVNCDIPLNDRQRHANPMAYPRTKFVLCRRCKDQRLYESSGKVSEADFPLMIGIHESSATSSHDEDVAETADGDADNADAREQSRLSSGRLSSSPQALAGAHNSKGRKKKPRLSPHVGTETVPTVAAVAEPLSLHEEVSSPADLPNSLLSLPVDHETPPTKRSQHSQKRRSESPKSHPEGSGSGDSDRDENESSFIEDDDVSDQDGSLFEPSPRADSSEEEEESSDEGSSFS